MNRKQLLFVPALLILAALACNAPSAQGNPAAATITALAATIQAQNAPGSTDTPASAVLPAGAATVTLTPTPSVPIVTVSQATNCRSGPGIDYDLLGAVNVGQTAVVVGKYTPGNYVIINNLNGVGTCWLWGQYATVSGNTTGLPEMTPPPTPTPKSTKTPKPTSTITPTPTLAPPAAPSFLANTRACEGGFRGFTPIWIETINLTWQDNADNETGYRVYKNGSALPALGPNSTSYHITLRYDQGTGGALWDNFGVEAFNDAGASARPAMDVPKCP